MIDPNDNNACTVDSCDMALGVINTIIDPSDNNVCTTDVCDPLTGITHTAVVIDDANVCTTDACDPVTGIAHTAVVIDDANACTTDACNTATGAITHVAIAITDNNACTTDACNTMTGAITHVAIAPAPDANGCTTDVCNPATGATTHTAIAGCQCNHSLCSTGTALNAAACTWQPPGTNDDCATKVCAIDSFCCTNSWDAACVGEAKNLTICTTGSTAFTCTCAHSYCATGVAMAPLCDPCVKKICEVDSFCCTNSWDSVCVGETHSVCQVPLAPACL
jgi:hypothetical protein